MLFRLDAGEVAFAGCLGFDMGVVAGAAVARFLHQLQVSTATSMNRSARVGAVVAQGIAVVPGLLGDEGGVRCGYSPRPAAKSILPVI